MVYRWCVYIQLNSNTNTEQPYSEPVGYTNICSTWESYTHRSSPHANATVTKRRYKLYVAVAFIEMIKRKPGKYVIGRFLITCNSRADLVVAHNDCPQLLLHIGIRCTGLERRERCTMLEVQQNDYSRLRTTEP